MGRSSTWMEGGLGDSSSNVAPAEAPLAYQPTGGMMTNYRWVVCALLFAATTINYVDRQILSLLKETLDAELHWTNVQFGFANSLFQLSYGLSFLAFGWFIDRFGTRIGYAVSISLWSLAAAAHAAVGSVNGFYAARVALGFGEAGNFPSAIKATAQWFPRRQRALATAIFNSGASVAAVAAPLSVPFIAAAWGWHATFLLAGGAGFIWLMFWWVFYEVPERHRRISEAERGFILSDRDEPKQERKASWSSILGYRQAWSFITAKFLTDPVWWFFLTWLPDFFKQTRGMDIKKSAAHLATIYAIITVLSIFGGWLPGMLIKQGYSASTARKLAMLFFAFCALPVFFVTSAGNIWVAVTLIGIAGAAHQAWSANLFTTVSDMFPKSVVASLTSLGGLSGSIGGFIFPIVAGKMLDHFKDLGNSTTGYTLLFTVCAFAYLVAFGISHLLAPRFEQVPHLPDPGADAFTPSA